MAGRDGLKPLLFWMVGRFRPRYAEDTEGLEMYWDVVEVKPEPDYRLFVRFADGRGGRVQLAPEDFTGVLAPFREPSFFRQVFVDRGAVALPGEIDLAPDAMYRQVVGSGRRRTDARQATRSPAPPKAAAAMNG